MDEPWLLPVDFPAYLEAKIEVDDRSLNPRLWARVCERIRGLEGLRLLDVGTGTGAMLRRMLEQPLRGGAQLVGLDPDRRSLGLAVRRIRREIAARGWSVELEERADRIEMVGRRAGEPSAGPRMLLVRGGLLDGNLADRLGAEGFDLVSAHACLDLLPPQEALAALRGLLRPGGWLYATINYDGLTVLLPPYGEPELESRLLERYDLSMDERRAGGRATAGRWSGRRLCQSLPGSGHAILDVGASDWMVFPISGGHSPSRRLFLRTLLTFMAREALAGGGFDTAAVQRWYLRRLEAVEDGSLALMTHQLDLLAEAQP